MNIKAKICKTNEERHLVFGFASVSAQDGTAVVDSDGDTIAIEELERAAYDFVEKSRVGKADHDGEQIATLIESLVITKEKAQTLGIADNVQGWFIGLKVLDENVWQKIKNGDYRMFSIGFRAVRRKL